MRMGNVTNLSLNGFKWVENASQFNEDFTKIYNEESDEGLPFLLETMKIKKLQNL